MCYSGKGRRLGTATTVQHVPCHEYLQSGPKIAFPRCNRGNALHDQDTSHGRLRCELVSSWDSWTWKGIGCDMETPGYWSWKSYRQWRSLPKWYKKQFTDMLQVEWNWSTSTKLPETADTKADATPRQIAPCATWWQWGSSSFVHR